ncbi:MAG: hypothetical protein AAGD11_01690 [Planctomycetota bacterium]
MSQPSFESASVPSVITKKGVLDVYTVMLIIALVCLLMGCLFLWLEIGEYGGFGAIKGPVAMIIGPLGNLMGGVAA